MAKRGGKKDQKAAKGKQGQRRFGGGAVEFARNTRSELRKVTWPDRDQLRQSTLVVLTIVIALGIYVFVWDQIFEVLARVVFL